MAGSEFASVFYGLASAASWGAGDFSGGLASRRASTYSVVVTSQIIGLAMLLLLALAFRETFPPVEHLVWGGFAGVAGTVGLLALYTAFSSGRMGMAAPIAAVVTAIIPVIFGVISDGVPEASKLVGFVLAFMAVWLISTTGGGLPNLQELRLPVFAGLGFGVFFILLDRANDVSIFWPLVAARMTSLTLLIAASRVRRQPILTDRSLLLPTVLCGILDAGGNAFYALAAQTGRLDVAAILASLYPASTILLAALILKERISRVQAMGIVACLAAIALIAS